MKKVFLFVILFAVSFSYSQVRVRKNAKEGTPGVYVHDSNVPALSRKLRRLLGMTGWLDLVTSKDKAAYEIYPEYMQGLNIVNVSIRSGGREIARIKENRTGEKGDMIAYCTADKILNKLFNADGIWASKIAFVTSSGLKKEVYSCYPDGDSMNRMTYNNSISTEPNWGTASTLTYTLYRSGRTMCVRQDLKRRKQKVLSQYPGLNSGGDLSPDGKYVALTLSLNDKVDLYLINLKGGKRRLTFDKATESAPSWSPRGGQVCYVSDVTGRPSLFVVSTDGSNRRRITRDGYESVSPSWSPKNNMICYSSRRAGHYVITVLDLDNLSAKPRVICDLPGDWEAPSWAPDGRHIVCSRTVNGKSGLVLIDMVTEKVSAITRPAAHILPEWGPLF